MGRSSHLDARRVRRAAALAGAAVLGTVLSTGSVSGAAPAPRTGRPPGTPSGSVSLSPARLVTDAPAGPYTFRLTVTNDQAKPTSVELAQARLEQDSQGMPSFGPPEPGPLRLSATRFDLAAHSARSVAVTAPVGPSTAGLYEAVLATMVPVDQGRRQIAVHERLAALVELTGPGARVRSAKIASISTAGSRRGGHLFFAALVRDTGNVLIDPTGVAFVAVAGHQVATVPLGSTRIVPGAAVALQGAWDAPRELDGRVAVRVDLSDPTADATTAVTFRAGAAPLTAARIEDLRYRPTPKGVQLTVAVVNTGNRRLAATVESASFDGHHYVPAAYSPTGGVAPGQRAQLRQQIDLSPGVHELSVKVVAGPATLDQDQLTVRVAPEGGGLGFVAPTAVLVSAVGASGLVFRRRRRGRSAPLR